MEDLHHTKSPHIFKMFLDLSKSQRNEVDKAFCLLLFFGIIKVNNESLKLNIYWAQSKTSNSIYLKGHI